MTTPVFLDVFESETLEKLIAQSVQVQRQALNAKGMADVLILAWDAHRIGIENKQADEILGDMDGCEDQLRRQYPHAEENLLLVRGIIIPDKLGCTTLRQAKANPYLFHKSQAWPKKSYLGYRRWLYSLDKMGITVIEVPSTQAAATEIVAIHAFAQDKEHSTLNRYIKHKLVLAERDQYVETLMGVAGAMLGETKAKELIRVFGTPFGVYCRSVEELCQVGGIGPTIAAKILKGVGR